MDGMVNLMYSVYSIWYNDKCVYVGKDCSIQQNREKTHLSAKGDKKQQIDIFMQETVGWVWKVLVMSDYKEAINEIERFYIKKYKPQYNWYLKGEKDE